VLSRPLSAPVTYNNDFLSPEAAVWLFDQLWDHLDWERRPGSPRREYWANTFNRDYTYGKNEGVRTYKARPFTPAISGVLQALLQDFRTGNILYEGCFLNGYETSSDALGWHADDDPGIDHTRPIAIVTLYASEKAKPRNISFREVIERPTETTKGVYGPIETLALENGSLALMEPGMQFTHVHKIPKAGFVAEPRISLTFRGLV
jgi:alkylated DNA repair dioxygenase AlkB